MIIYMICLAGCLYQILYSSFQYFAYATTTKVDSKLKDNIRYPAPAFCTRTFDLLDAEVVSSRNLTPSNILDILTIGEISDMTPTTNETMDNCQFRMGRKRIFQQYNNSVCNENFRVDKYVVGENICYVLVPRKWLLYSLSYVASDIMYSLSVYELRLSNKFNGTKNIFMPAFYPPQNKEAPFRFDVASRKFGEIVIRYNYENWIIIRPHTDIFRLLPPPYDTKCKYSDHYCFPNCIIAATVRILGKFPFCEASNGSHGALKVLSWNDLSNRTTATRWMKSEEQCKKLCSSTRCVTKITSNIAELLYRYGVNTSMAITASVPSSTAKSVVSVASINFIEYVSGICTAIGIWFGMSVVAMIPVKTNFFMPSRPKLKNILLCLYYLFVMAGFTYQAVQVSIEYFAYRTSSTVSYAITDDYRFQSIGFCFNFIDIVNRTDHQRKGLYSTVVESNSHWPNETYRMNIAKMLSVTPELGDFVASCGVRDSEGYQLLYYTPDECLNYFNYYKAVSGLVVCYIVSPKEDLRFSWSNVGNAYSNKGQVYSLSTKIELNRTLIMRILSYENYPSNNPWPTISQYFGKVISVFPKNVINIESTASNVRSLPRPYDTQCVLEFNFNACKQDCLIAQLSSISRVPYSILLHDRNLTMRSVHFYDLNDEKMFDAISKSEIICQHTCHKSPCHQVISFTSSRVYKMPSVKNNTLRITSFTPQSPTLFITSIAYMNLKDFVLFIGNCFNIWFGISIISVKSCRVWQCNRLMMKKPTQAVAQCVDHSSYFSICFHIICYVGFCYHLSRLFTDYFAFQTRSRFEIKDLDHHAYPTLTLCSRFQEIIDIPQELEKTDYTNLTIKQILDFTPKTESIVTACRKRDKHGKMNKYSADRCRQSSKVLKYVAGADICYQYVVTVNATYSLTRVTSALSDVGRVYDVFLNKSLSKGLYLRFVTMDLSNRWISLTQPNQWLPTLSRKYGETVPRSTDESASNIFIIQGTAHHFDLLPPPYDTGCAEDNDAENCVPVCRAKQFVEKLGLVAFDLLVSEELNMRQLSQEDLKNQTIKGIVDDINNDCHTICPKVHCDTSFSVTSTQDYFSPDIENNELVISAGVQKSNTVLVRAFPAITFIEFINSVSVSASLWLGISVLSFLSYSVECITRRPTNDKEPRSRLRKSKNQTNTRLRVISRSNSFCKRFRSDVATNEHRHQN